MSMANTHPEATTPVPNAVVPYRGIGRMFFPEKAIPKADIPEAAKRIVEAMRDNTDALTAYAMLKNAEVLIKESIAQCLDFAVVKMSGKEVEVFGAKITTRRVVEYEYNDPTLDGMKEKLETLKAEIKERESYLRTIKEPIIVEATGESIQPAKKIRDGQTLAVSFK